MKTTITNLLLLTIVLYLSTAHNALANSQLEAIEVEEGIDIQLHPLEAIQKIVELGKDASNLTEDLANQKSAPISFKELIEYLPRPPEGWTADRPQGETNSFGSYSISQVDRAYTQKNKRIKVNIFDWAFNSALYTPFILSTEFSQESTEGYNKGIKIGDIPGREEYNYSKKQGSLSLLVDSRFLIQINGRNIEDVELRKWWELMEQSSFSKISNK